MERLRSISRNLTKSSWSVTTQYPGGLDDGPQGFNQPEVPLSVSLTFYEFALVGDKDDNNTYSANEATGYSARA